MGVLWSYFPTPASTYQKYDQRTNSVPIKQQQKYIYIEDVVLVMVAPSTKYIFNSLSPFLNFVQMGHNYQDMPDQSTVPINKDTISGIDPKCGLIKIIADE